MPTSLEYEIPIAASTSTISINTLAGMRNAGVLVVRPPFQRNLVWTADQQTLLVDSVLRGLPVPEVYVQTRIDFEGREQTIVVDGQQRISACLRFITDDLRLQPLADLDPRWSGKKFSELEVALQLRFRSFELVVRKLPDVGDEALREIFRRLNKTVEPLEPQELRHAAYTGPFIGLVEAIAADPVLSEVGAFSAKDYLRRRNDEFIAEVCFAVGSRAFPNKKEGLDELFLTFETQGVPESFLDLDRRFGRVFVVLEDIAGAIRRTRFRNKSDFYSLMVLLASNAERLPFPDNDGFTDAISAFSQLVNAIKREEAAERSIDSLVAGTHGPEASRYLRAVERAASDRLNRVRRNDALVTIVEPYFSTVARPFSESDREWTLRLADDGDEMDNEPTPEDRESAERALLFPRADLEESS